MRRILERFFERLLGAQSKPLEQVKLTPEQQLEISRVVEHEVERRVRRAVVQYNVNLAIVTAAILAIAAVVMGSTWLDLRRYVRDLFKQHAVQKEYEAIQSARTNAFAAESEILDRLKTLRKDDNIVRVDKSGYLNVTANTFRVIRMDDPDSWFSLSLSTQYHQVFILTSDKGHVERAFP
jgi:hypothetical protein